MTGNRIPGQRSEREVIADAYSIEHRSKTAPVQGYPGGIPWPIHLEAYEAYCRKWSAQPALINLPDRGCRGGFSVGELDDLVPGWRDRVTELGQLRSQVISLTETIRKIECGLRQVSGDIQTQHDNMPSPTARKRWGEFIDRINGYAAELREAIQ